MAWLVLVAFVFLVTPALVAGKRGSQSPKTQHFSGQNTTGPACANGTFFDPYINGCAIACPLPLIFNPTTFNCSLPCIIFWQSEARMNGLRVTTVVLGWLNIVALTSILALYTIRLPKRWISFPTNMMLIMLLLNLPVSKVVTRSNHLICIQTSITYVMSTGHSLRGWICKNPYEAYNGEDARARAQGGIQVFWSVAG